MIEKEEEGKNPKKPAPTSSTRRFSASEATDFEQLHSTFIAPKEASFPKVGESPTRRLSDGEGEEEKTPVTIRMPRQKRGG